MISVHPVVMNVILWENAITAIQYCILHDVVIVVDSVDQKRDLSILQ